MAETDKTEGTRVNRAEWGVVVSLCLSAGSVIFSAGILYQSQQDQGRRIALMEQRADTQATRTDTLTIRIERIDANVQYLADRAREDRERGRRLSGV